jgi:hypothetical protein
MPPSRQPPEQGKSKREDRKAKLEDRKLVGGEPNFDFRISSLDFRTVPRVSGNYVPWPRIIDTGTMGRSRKKKGLYFTRDWLAEGDAGGAKVVPEKALGPGV